MEFRPPSCYARAALIAGPLHGYAIVRRAAELSGGAVRLSAGTLYAMLERAIADGLVTTGEPHLERGHRRRDYTLTQAGHVALWAQAASLERAAKTLPSRLRASARGMGA